MATDEPVEYLVSRRSRRSTAGNRMAAALAEIAFEEANKDLDDDNEFVVEKYEEDAFESDFESTDEEAAANEEEAGEKEVQEEEKRARKAARSKLEKATAAAHEKHKATFNPVATVDKPKPKPRPEKSRVSLGAAVNAETGEVLVAGNELGAEISDHKRKSKRKHTVLNTSATVSRLKESEEKKASLPKKARPATRSFSQLELIALALDNEEGNLIEHRDYLKLEEEKRARARVVRKTVDGHLVRWVSRVEDVTEVLQPPPPPPPEPLATGASAFFNSFGTSIGRDLRFIQSQALAGPSNLNATHPASTVTVPTPVPPIIASARIEPENVSTGQSNVDSASVSSPPPVPATGSVIPSNASATVGLATPEAAPLPPPFQVWPPPPPPPPPTTVAPEDRQPSNSDITLPIMSQSSFSSTAQAPISTAETPSQTGSSSVSPITAEPQPQQAASTGLTVSPLVPSSVWASTPVELDSPSVSILTTQLATPQAPQTVTYKTTRNYLVHELNQTQSAPKPQWKDTMAALFGDHVKWEEQKVYVGKGRPLSRPVQTCPITGLPAPYMDPRTGVPYANQHAYNVLTRILKHEYAWSPSLGCYTSEIKDVDPPSARQEAHMEIDQ